MPVLLACVYYLTINIVVKITIGFRIINGLRMDIIRDASVLHPKSAFN